MIDPADRIVKFPSYLHREWVRDLQVQAGSLPCVYMIYSGDRLLYVGRSSCAWRRLRGHILNWCSEDDGWPTHIVVHECVHECAKRLEARLIDEMQPPRNRKREMVRARKYEAAMRQTRPST